jgi:hypothetical protein
MQIKRNILFALLLLATSAVAQEQMALQDNPAKASTVCKLLLMSGKVPSYYCDCWDDNTDFKLPMDITIKKDDWYKCSLGQLKNGMTAYLYSDCDVTLDVYGDCALFSPSYTYTFTQNQARDVDGEKIVAKVTEKLAELGMSYSDDRLVYFRISPVGSGTGRLLCCTYNQGPTSTCSDILPLLMSMTFVSSHQNDVYLLSADLLPETDGISVHWDSDVDCTLRVARGNCNADAVLEAEMLAGDTYRLPMELLNEVRESGEDLYLQFGHKKNTVGRLRLGTYTPDPPATPDPPTTPTATDQLHNAATNTQLRMTREGVLYIERAGEKYSVLGQRL